MYISFIYSSVSYFHLCSFLKNGSEINLNRDQFAKTGSGQNITKVGRGFLAPGGALNGLTDGVYRPGE